MEDLEQIKKRIANDLEYIHIDAEALRWRQVVLALIEHIETLHAERNARPPTLGNTFSAANTYSPMMELSPLVTTQVRKPI